MTDRPEPSRSDVWLIELEPKPDDVDSDEVVDVRREIRGIRPGLIISAERVNQSPGGFAFVAPCTTTDQGIPGHIKVSPPEGGFDRKSFIMCDQIRCIDRSRLNHRLGAVSDDTMEAVEKYLRMFLAL